uniref:Zinc finger protein 483 n=1 Tax=Loxodonta africana TaxID=9785 RepID=G3TCP4_LOXAF
MQAVLLLNKMEATFSDPHALASSEQNKVLKLDAPGDQEAILRGDATDPETSRQRFRWFRYSEVAGPRKALNHLWELCVQWLRPDIHTKEQILELLVFEQFLAILPGEIRNWVKSQHPESSEKVVTLVEDLTQMLEEKDDPISQDNAISQDENPEEDKMTVGLPSAEASVSLRSLIFLWLMENWKRALQRHQKIRKKFLLTIMNNIEFLGLPVSKLELISQLKWVVMPWLLEKEGSKGSRPGKLV